MAFLSILEWNFLERILRRFERSKRIIDDINLNREILFILN